MKHESTKYTSSEPNSSKAFKVEASQSPSNDDQSKRTRVEVLKISHKTRSGHIGSAFSSIDILSCLYDGFLKLEPFEKRDRFIMGKGHASAAFYVALHEAEIIDSEMLSGFAVNGGTLRHHPDRDERHGIEVTTGSLGHGLSMASGLAYGAKIKRASWRTVVLLSDGELNEGMTWEAALFAAHHKLNNILAIVDVNKIQALGHTRDILELEDLVAKWQAFGWAVRRIDGHNFDMIRKTLDEFPFDSDKPSIIIADTVKGKGVSFMEDKLLWHYRCPDGDEYKCAMNELLNEKDEG